MTPPALVDLVPLLEPQETARPIWELGQKKNTCVVDMLHLKITQFFKGKSFEKKNLHDFFGFQPFIFQGTCWEFPQFLHIQDSILYNLALGSYRSFRNYRGELNHQESLKLNGDLWRGSPSETIMKFVLGCR